MNFDADIRHRNSASKSDTGSAAGLGEFVLVQLN